MCPILESLAPLFWNTGESPLDFKGRIAALFDCFAEANVMYIP